MTGEAVGVFGVESGLGEVAIVVVLEKHAGPLEHFGPASWADFGVAADFFDEVFMPADGGHGAAFKGGDAVGDAVPFAVVPL